MTKLIDCFLPQGNAEETRRNVEELKSYDTVATVNVVEGNIKASATLKDIANKATAPYTLLYLKGQFIKLGYLALDRMLALADITKAGMIYADHYNIAADGTRSEAPVIDYQVGSLRDDFNFGSVLLFRTESLKEAASMMKADYQAAGFYDLRLKLTEKYTLEHINEYLYSEVELDTRKTGEKLFDYVDPKNRASQIEMEQAATEYLKEVGGYLKPGFKDVDITEGEFPVEMTVMIPVRNRIRTIRDAIDSALQQKTTFKYNVFVVENGPECHSTDGTTEAVDEYTDPRLIHVVTERRDLCVGGSWNLAAHDPRCGRLCNSTPMMCILTKTRFKNSTMHSRNRRLPCLSAHTFLPILTRTYCLRARLIMPNGHLRTVVTMPSASTVWEHRVPSSRPFCAAFPCQT